VTTTCVVKNGRYIVYSSWKKNTIIFY
jgi:hypothetical protein